jgi:mannose-6-phosphate isomerase-like protein (cupin superfamily)
MKKLKILICLSIVATVLYLASPIIAQQLKVPYILENDVDVSKLEPGTHNGGGVTIGHTFFGKADDFKLVFKKRILKPGSAIGYHLQKEDEIYYVLNGEGEMKMNGKSFKVKAGDAILTRPGSSHGLKVIGDEDLTIIINYEKL